MKQQQINSIWESIDAQRDALRGETPKFEKHPCFPVPYTLVTLQKPIAGGKVGIVPCVELKNIHGGYEFRRCDDILKPVAGEPIDIYFKRLKWELERKDILGETIL